MITCPRCGTQNPAGSRFCSNCGNDLSKVTSAESKPAWVTASEVPPTSPEWRMSPAGPLPEPPRRRTWLWVVLGIIGACVLICCAGFIWLSTAGQGFVCDQFMPAMLEQARSTGDRETIRQMEEQYRDLCLNTSR